MRRRCDILKAQTYTSLVKDRTYVNWLEKFSPPLALVRMSDTVIFIIQCNLPQPQGNNYH